MCRYKDVIKKLNVDIQYQHVIIKSVAEFWRHSYQHITVLVDKLMSYNIVSPVTITNWIFTQIADFHLSYLWEILRNTVDKTVTRLELGAKQFKDKNQIGDEKKEMTVEAWQKEKKDLFICVFENFLNIMANTQVNNSNLESIIEARFKQFGRMFEHELQPYMNDLDNLVSNSSVENRIKDFFFLFKTLA